MSSHYYDGWNGAEPSFTVTFKDLPSKPAKIVMEVTFDPDPQDAPAAKPPVVKPAPRGRRFS